MTLKKSAIVKDLLFHLAVTWKLYFGLSMASKILLVQKNIYFFIQGLIKVFIAVIQMSLGRDIRLLRVKYFSKSNLNFKWRKIFIHFLFSIKYIFLINCKCSSPTFIKYNKIHNNIFIYIVNSIYISCIF